MPKPLTELAKEARDLAAFIVEECADEMFDHHNELLERAQVLLAAIGAHCSPFKVGDRVIVARKVETDSAGRDCQWCADRFLGEEATVTTVDFDIDPQIPYKLDAGGGYYWFSPEALDLVSSA